MSEVKLPRLLDDDLQNGVPLHPTRLSASLSLESLSTATMILPDGEPVVGMRRFVELYGENGSMGIFRVSGTGSDYGSEQQIRLEHGITTLDDVMIMLPDDADGNAVTEITDELRPLIAKILSYQSTERWVLGAVEAPAGKKITVSADRTSALSCLMDAVKQAYGYGLTFDQSKTPWVVGVKALPKEAACECRLMRNTDGVKATMDEETLCTRALSKALPNGSMDADTVHVWGVIEKALPISDDAEQAQAVAYAKEYLEINKNPTLTVEVDAVQLAELTGESLDRFVLGTVCRVALPEYGVTMNERIITMRYQDLLGAPQQVRLTLSSPKKDVSTRLSTMRREVEREKSRSRGFGRGIGKAMEYITELDGTLTLQDERIELIATDVDENTGALSTASIRLDGVEADLLLKASRSEVTDLERRLSLAEIDIDGANAAILLKASQSTVDALGKRMSSAEIKIDGANAEIALKVNKNGVISSINQTAESIKIQASKINLEGYVTASKLSAELASMSQGYADRLTTKNLEVLTLAKLKSINFDGNIIGKASRNVVTSVTMPTLTFHDISYKDPSGSTTTTRVCVGYKQGSSQTAYLQYLNY